MRHRYDGWKDLCCAPVLYLNYNLFSTKIIKLNGLTLEFEIIYFRTKVLMHRMCVIPDHIVLAHRYDFCILMIKFDISFPHGCTYFTVVFFVTGVLLCSDRDLRMWHPAAPEIPVTPGNHKILKKPKHRLTRLTRGNMQPYLIRQ